LISLIMAMVNFVYNCLRDGLFGRFFTSYTAEENLFKKGWIGKLFSKRSKASIGLRKIRLRLAEFFEKSLIIEKMTNGATYMLGCSFRFYGIAVLTFGAYSVLVFYIKQYAFPNMIQSNISLGIGFALLILGLLMMGSKQSIAALVQRGIIPHSLLIDILGIPEERLDVPRVKNGGRYNVSLIIGMLFGVLTFLIPPQTILFAVICFIAIAIVMSYPEIGVLALIAFLPFFRLIEIPFDLLDLTVAVTAIAYLGKLIRGKRILRFSLFDVMVLFLLILVWFSGLVSIGGEVSLQKAQHACLVMLVYFMIVNLIRTPAWLHRATVAFVGAAVILAFSGIVQYIAEMNESILRVIVSLPWNMHGASSIFDAPNAFGAYLMAVLPFCLAIMTNAFGTKSRLIAILCGMLILVAAGVTWSRSAWFGILVAVLIYFLIYSRKTVCWLLIGGLTVPLWCSFLPHSFVRYCLNMMDLSDPAIYHQIFTWRGSARMISNHILGGIGYGTEAFQEVYPQYSFIGLEMSESTGSLFLTLFAVMGILGVLVFVAAIIIFVQHCLEYIGNASENYSRSFVAAGFSSVIGTMATGIGSDIWYNETVFMCFVAVVAMTCAYIRAGTLIRARNHDVSNVDLSHAYVDLHFEV